MGYQESLIKIKKEHQKKFINDVCKSWLTKTYDNNDMTLADPTDVIRVKKDIKEFNLEKGDLLLMVCGERSVQRSVAVFLSDMGMKNNKDYLDSNIIFYDYIHEYLDGAFNHYYKNCGLGYDENFEAKTLEKYIEDCSDIELKEKYERSIPKITI